jgi:hypothetical protein
MDAWTKSLLTNREVIAVSQTSSDEQEALREAGNVVWTAKAAKGTYVAAVNLSDTQQQIEYAWNQIGIHGSSVKVRDLWLHKGLGKHDRLRVTLPPHASVLYRVNY